MADSATHDGAAVRRIDTHISHIFLAGDDAWKLKRAVKLSFLDFSTLEKRRQACEAEVALNRRTAPSLYKGVVPVTRQANGALALGGPRYGARGEYKGEIVDYLVHMARFAEGALLSELAEKKALSSEVIRDLGDTLAQFHATCEVNRGATGGALAMSRVVSDVSRALSALPNSILDGPETKRWVTRARGELQRLWSYLEARRAGGFVRHCHGDMHLANIAMIGGKALPFDAIEFSREVATVDVLYDLAFPVMDLLHFGERGLANLLMNRYLAATRDYAGLRGFSFYMSLRAAIRAMVLGLEAVAEHDHQRARADARRFLALAHNLLRPAPARLIAVGGLSGVGKSTIARQIAIAAFPGPGAVVISSDPARKYMFGRTPETRLPLQAYGSAVSEMLFDQFYGDIGEALQAGASVVADATFARPRFRGNVEDVAREAAVPFTGLWLEAPVRTLLCRLRARPKGASDADAHILALQLEKGTGPIGWARVDTSGSPGQTIDRARAALRCAEPLAA